jgi:hypothetical protein
LGFLIFRVGVVTGHKHASVKNRVGFRRLQHEMLEFPTRFFFRVGNSNTVFHTRHPPRAAAPPPPPACGGGAIGDSLPPPPVPSSSAGSITQPRARHCAWRAQRLRCCTHQQRGCLCPLHHDTTVHLATAPASRCSHHLRFGCYSMLCRTTLPKNGCKETQWRRAFARRPCPAAPARSMLSWQLLQEHCSCHSYARFDTRTSGWRPPAAVPAVAHSISTRR